jgi:hypothetical protein
MVVEKQQNIVSSLTSWFPSLSFNHPQKESDGSPCPGTTRVPQAARRHDAEGDETVPPAIVPSVQTGRKALRELLWAGRIERIGGGFKGNPFRHFRAARSHRLNRLGRALPAATGICNETTHPLPQANWLLNYSQIGLDDRSSTVKLGSPGDLGD